MWKVFIEYKDGLKLTITGENKALSLELARKYFNKYVNGRWTRRCEYQQYPKNKNKAIDLDDYIDNLEEWAMEECEIDA